MSLPDRYRPSGLFPRDRRPGCAHDHLRVRGVPEALLRGYTPGDQKEGSRRTVGPYLPHRSRGGGEGRSQRERRGTLLRPRGRAISAARRYDYDWKGRGGGRQLESGRRRRGHTLQLPLAHATGARRLIQVPRSPEGRVAVRTDTVVVEVHSPGPNLPR